MMEKIKISKGTKEIGTISFDKQNNKFIFEYHQDFRGYDFGQLDYRNGRRFEAKEMFGIFSYPDCWSRREHCRRLNIKDPDSNESQWFFMTLGKQKGENGRGLFFEKYNKLRKGVKEC